MFWRLCSAMELAEIQLIDVLERALLKKQRAINVQLKTVQKHENKLTKALLKEQKRQAAKDENRTNPAVIRYKADVEKQNITKTQLEEKLSTIKLKIMELKQRKAAV